MKQKSLLRSMLLLFALIVGMSSAWGQTAAVVGTELWSEPFKGSPSSSTAFSATTSWDDYLDPTTFVASDASSLSYTSSNAMANSGSANNMTGAHVWLNKSVDSYIQVTGIKLYNATKVKVSWAQATKSSKTTVYYQFDGSGDFEALSTCSGPSANFESDELSVSNHTTIALKFMHPSNNTANTRIDDLKLTVTEIEDTPSAPLDHISLSGNYPTTFRQGDAFSHEGMTVTAYYGTGNDVTTMDVTSSAEFSGYDMSTIGNQTVTVSYTEETGIEAITKTATYAIEVTAPPTLSSIALSGTYPTTFFVGDAFSHEGMTVTATFSDNSTENVTAAATFTGYNMSQAGEQTVTVTYTYNNVSVTQTYTITVNEIPTKTIAQFILAGGGKCYLTGTVSNIVNTTYGNFDLTDASGTIYVYGCLTAEGVAQQFGSLGIEEGNKIKVLADQYTLYNNKDEAVNVKFVEKIVVPTHTLTTSATNGTIEIDGKTANANNEYTIEEEFTITATATPAEHYTFSSWSATGVTLSDATANPVEFEMPAADVTLTANFTENAKHDATFYVQGFLVNTDANVYEGDAITFPTSVTVPTGYTLVGWTTAEITGETNTAPETLVTAANMGDDDVAFYAVFAIGTVTGSDTYEKLASQSFDTNANYVIGAKGAGDDNNIYYLYSYNNKVDENASWGLVSSDLDNYTPIQFRLSGTSDALVAKDNSGNYLKALTSSNFQMSSTSTTVVLDTDGSIKNSSSGTYYLRYNTSGGLRWYSSNTGQKAYFYKVIPGIIYASYCTTVPTSGTITLNAACHDGSTIYGTYYTNRAYVMPATLKGSVVSVDADGKLVVDAVYDGSNNEVVPANVALLISTDDSFTGTKDYTITYSTGGDDYSEYNMLKGTMTADEMTEGENCLFYRLTMQYGTTIGFWWGAENGGAFKPGAHKAYLAVPNSTGAPAMGFGFDDATTSIQYIERTINDNQYYTLDGRRVAEPTKGLYILNGRKVVVK